VAGIPVVDCATGTCVPCSAEDTADKHFLRVDAAPQQEQIADPGVWDQNLSHTAIITFYCQIPRSRSKEHLTICGHRCPSGTMRKAVCSASLFGGLSVRLSQWKYLPQSTARVHIGKFAGFSPGFTSVVLPPGRIRKRLSKSEERTLSDTFDCVTPASQSNLGLKPCGSGTCKLNSPGCFANKQLILKSIAVKSQ
jgi:hypothetical protein